MNRYGEQARSWWMQLAPTDYVAMQDPEAFFTRLGEQAADEVADLTEMILERDKVPGEDKERMRFAARLSAEEMLLPPRYVWDSDPDAEDPVDEQALEASWAEEEEWAATVERRQQEWERERRTHAELRARGWSDEKIREVGARIDLSDPDAIALLTQVGLL